MSFSSERAEEEGDFEDGNIATDIRDRKAKYNDQAAASLALQLKHGKELLCDNYSLYDLQLQVGGL